MRNDGFMTGMIAGLVVGMVAVMAMSPGARAPVMRGAGQMGRRMRKMWRRNANIADIADEMVPDDVF